MSKLPKLLVFLTALSPASALAARPVDPAPVVAAERAFAADGVALGWVAAFKKHVAPDGVTFSTDPVNAPANLAKQDDKKEGPDLVWWPLWAGLSRSGDLGFTTGPFRIGERPAGQYFTVWRRQTDGGWKWVFDGGPRVITPNAPPPGTEPGALAPATGPQVSAKVAMAQVDAAEAGGSGNAAGRRIGPIDGHHLGAGVECRAHRRQAECAETAGDRDASLFQLHGALQGCPPNRIAAPPDA